MERIVRYGFYPLLAAFTLGYLAIELGGPKEELGQYYGYYLAILITAMVLVEARVPMRREWRMTRATFFRRDLPYLVITAATVTLAGSLAAWALRLLGLEIGRAHV